MVNTNSADWEGSATRAEVRLRVGPDGRLAAPLALATPTRPPLVKVGRATYGHPLGAKRGRGAFDVTEVLQGRVDAADGAFLEMKHTEDLRALFDDPLPGMRKELVLDYELMGVGDTVRMGGLCVCVVVVVVVVVVVCVCVCEVCVWRLGGPGAQGVDKRVGVE